MFMSKADIKHHLLQQIDTFVASTTPSTSLSNSTPQSKIVSDLCSKKSTIQEGWLTVVEQLTVLCDERVLCGHVVHQCERDVDVIGNGVDMLSSVGVELNDVKMKHALCQVMHVVWVYICLSVCLSVCVHEKLKTDLS